MNPTYRTLIAAVFMVTTITAQALETFSVPPLINYQGQLMDENGVGITSVKKLEFNLYDAASGGARKWGPQVFNNVPVIQGGFNVILGTTDPDGKFITDAFESSERYLGIKVTDAGGDLTGIPELTPRQQILSAPYAVVAGKVHFAEQNTDWGRIYFESNGDEAQQSNMVFQTFDNNHEGFLFVTTAGGGENAIPTIRVRIDSRGLFIREGMYSNIVPAGTIIAYGGHSHPPGGWLHCAGAAVSSEDYPALFQAIGTGWGNGLSDNDPRTNFNLPDLIGRFVRGRDYKWGRDPDWATRFANRTGGATGDAVGSVQGEQFRSHNHANGNFRHLLENNGLDTATARDNQGGGEPNIKGSREILSSGGNETRPINAYVNWYVKY